MRDGVMIQLGRSRKVSSWVDPVVGSNPGAGTGTGALTDGRLTSDWRPNGADPDGAWRRHLRS